MQHLALRSALSALCRLKTHEYEGELSIMDELEIARGVEQSLLSQLEVERALRLDLEASLRSTDDDLRALRNDNVRLTAELQEEQTTADTSQAAQASLLARIQEIEMKYALYVLNLALCPEFMSPYPDCRDRLDSRSYSTHAGSGASSSAWQGGTMDHVWNFWA